MAAAAVARGAQAATVAAAAAAGVPFLYLYGAAATGKSRVVAAIAAPGPWVAYTVLWVDGALISCLLNDFIDAKSTNKGVNARVLASISCYSSSRSLHRPCSVF
jgi:hypothetical protein